MKILLCGFMGSGKTTLFNKVKNANNAPKCLDLDDLLRESLAKEGESLGAAVRRVGWEVFRKKESGLLNKLLNEESDHLISLGGGALNHALLKEIAKDEKVKLVWLKTPFKECWKRIEGDSNRPLVDGGEKELKRLFDERLPLYSQAVLHLDVHEQQGIESFHGLLHILDDRVESKA